MTSPHAGTEKGTTTIAAAVVQKIARRAVDGVDGIHAVGGGLSRSVSALRSRIPGAGTSGSSGVQAEVGTSQAAVDVDVVAEYGASIPAVARTLRSEIIGAVERMTPLEVVEVGIAVSDVHVPEDARTARGIGRPRQLEESSAPQRPGRVR